MATNSRTVPCESTVYEMRRSATPVAVRVMVPPTGALMPKSGTGASFTVSRTYVPVRYEGGSGSVQPASTAVSVIAARPSGEWTILEGYTPLCWSESHVALSNRMRVSRAPTERFHK